MISVREIASALQLGLTGHFARPRHLMLIVAGFAIAGLALILLLSVPAGLMRLGEATGRDDVAIVMDASAQTETGGSIRPEAAAIVSSLPGVQPDSSGKPRVAPQFLAYTKLRRSDGELATVLMRGITPATWDVLGDRAPQVSGRLFGNAVNECLAGAIAIRGFSALDPGAQIKVRDSLWRVSGTLQAESLWGSELWADFSSLQATFNASTQPTTLWVKLESPDAYASFAQALGSDPRLRELRTERQRDYYSRQVIVVAYFALLASIGIAATLGLGASLAIGNALSLALVARRRELAILRALGFAPVNLALALMLEILAVGLVTTIAAIALLRGVLNDVQVGTSTGSQAIDFTLAITPQVMAWTLAYALLLGMVAAAWPARQAVRQTLIAALSGD